MVGTCVCCKLRIEGIYWIYECCNRASDHYGDDCVGDCECKEVGE